MNYDDSESHHFETNYDVEERNTDGSDNGGEVVLDTSPLKMLEETEKNTDNRRIFLQIIIYNIKNTR